MQGSPQKPANSGGAEPPKAYKELCQAIECMFNHDPTQAANRQRATVYTDQIKASPDGWKLLFQSMHLACEFTARRCMSQGADSDRLCVRRIANK